MWMGDSWFIVPGLLSTVPETMLSKAVPEALLAKPFS